MAEKGILNFRVEKSCFYRDHFYTASDEPGNHPKIVQFPIGSLLDVPQHFTLSDQDEETLVMQDKRDRFFAWVRSFAKGGADTPEDEVAMREKIRVGRENFAIYDGPVEKGIAPDTEAAGANDDGLEDLSKTALGIKLEALGLTYLQAESKASMVAKLRAALA